MKKIGLACVGGGAKSVANIGVIKALQEENIELSAISGTSMGSFVALMYALGLPPEEMLEKFKHYSSDFTHFSFKEKLFAPISLLKDCGLKNSYSINQFAQILLTDPSIKNMKDLDMPIFMPAMDVTNKKTIYYSSRELNGEECYLDRPIAEAIQSSAALPLLFTPNTVYINGNMHQFLDGGMTNNTPTNHLDEFSDIVIGVESKYYKNLKGKKLNFVTGIRNTFQGMRRSANTFQKKYSNIWISVDCGGNQVFGTEDDMQKYYEAGYNAAKQALSENKELFI